MTKSELKDIIKECYSEIMNENNDIVEESLDINTVNEDTVLVEESEYTEYLYNSLIAETTNFDNMVAELVAVEEGAKEVAKAIKDKIVYIIKKFIEFCKHVITKIKEFISNVKDKIRSKFYTAKLEAALKSDKGLKNLNKFLATEKGKKYAERFSEITKSYGEKIEARINKKSVNESTNLVNENFHFKLDKPTDILLMHIGDTCIDQFINNAYNIVKILDSVLYVTSDINSTIKDIVDEKDDYYGYGDRYIGKTFKEIVNSNKEFSRRIPSNIIDDLEGNLSDNGFITDFDSGMTRDFKYSRQGIDKITSDILKEIDSSINSASKALSKTENISKQINLAISKLNATKQNLDSMLNSINNTKLIVTIRSTVSFINKVLNVFTDDVLNSILSYVALCNDVLEYNRQTSDAIASMIKSAEYVEDDE